ncbi:MAG: WD40 repeat domain-containing protein [Candidatus Babeliaceae bacterium]
MKIFFVTICLLHFFGVVRAVQSMKLIAITNNGEVELPIYAAEKFKTIKNIMQDIDNADKEQKIEIPLPAINSSELHKIFQCLHPDGTVNQVYCNQLTESEWAERVHTIEYLDHKSLRKFEIKELERTSGSLEAINNFVTVLLPNQQPHPLAAFPQPVQQEITQHIMQRMAFELFPYKVLNWPTSLPVKGVTLEKNTIVSCECETIRVGIGNLATRKTHSLTGHTDWVNGVALEGNIIVSCSDDKTVRVWDSLTATMRNVLEGHFFRVLGVALEGNIIVSCAGDKTVRVEDLRTGKNIYILTGHTDCVNGVAFEENTIVSGSCDKTVKIWDLRTRTVRKVLAGHTDRVNGVALAENTIVSCSGDNTVRVWNLRTGTNRHILTGHTDRVTGVALAKNIIVSCSYDKTVKVWDLRTGNNIHILTGHTDKVTGVALEENIIVSGSSDKTVKEWRTTVPQDYDRASWELSAQQVAVLSYIKSHQDTVLSEEAQTVFDTVNPGMQQYFKHKKAFYSLYCLNYAF